MQGKAGSCNGNGSKAGRKFKAFNSAFDQYQRLKELLESTEDIREKNRIFLRLQNLLGVMEFLNAQSRLTM